MIESLEPRRLLAADPGLPVDLGPGSVTLRRGTLYVLGAADGQNLVAVFETEQLAGRNVEVVYRFGDAAVDAAATQPPQQLSFASRLVRRIIVAGGSDVDRVAVGSVPPARGETPPSDVSRAGDPTPYDQEAVAFTDSGRLRPGTVVRVYGRQGADVLIGGRARDEIYGGEDNDQLVGLALVDRLHGEEGDDRLEGHTGADRLFGESGVDMINLDRGSQRQDRIYGGPENDVIEFAPGVKLRDREGDDILQDKIP
jgi:Ca2+-binding RTX toxin-like protein